MNDSHNQESRDLLVRAMLQPRQVMRELAVEPDKVTVLVFFISFLADVR